MHVRAISTACLLLCLGWFSGACDDKTETTVDAKAKAHEPKVETKVETKVEETKVETKVDDAKVDDAKVDDAKVDDAKVDDAKVDDAKVDEKKADDKKADDKKTDDKKTGDTKKGADPKSDASAKVNAKEIYEKKCKTCHGATGNAKTKVGEENDIPDWTVAGWKAKWTEAKVIDIVKNGKSGTKMKAFKAKLTEDEIVAVSKYARSLGK